MVGTPTITTASKSQNAAMLSLAKRLWFLLIKVTTNCTTTLH